jgi:hypothetical protein
VPTVGHQCADARDRAVCQISGSGQLLLHDAGLRASVKQDQHLIGRNVRVDLPELIDDQGEFLHPRRILTLGEKEIGRETIRRLRLRQPSRASDSQAESSETQFEWLYARQDAWPAAEILRLHHCNTAKRPYEAPWSFLCGTMWSLISPRAKGISGPEEFWSSPQKDIFNTIRFKADIGW